LPEYDTKEILCEGIAGILLFLEWILFTVEFDQLSDEIPI